MYRASTTTWELSRFLQNICGQNTNLLWSLGGKGELEVRKAPHTQFSLTRCLIKLTYLCNGHPRRGPVLSHSPPEGEEVL